MKKAVIYIHGKGGNAAEAEHYKPLFPQYDMIGVDYHADTPWEAAEEFPKLYQELLEEYDEALLIANSIGAYFCMSAPVNSKITKAFLISPVVNMERLILDMMMWANVTEEQLRAKQVIATPFGETLSWSYLCYAREHPVHWLLPSEILYAGKDNLTSRETITAFAKQHDAVLTVMEDGEHWFHTAEQMDFLDHWLKAAQCDKKQLKD